MLNGRYQMLLALLVWPFGHTLAGQYWLDSDHMPIRDRFGDCVRVGAGATGMQPGCDAMDRVILLPDSSGTVGAVEISMGDAVVMLDSPYGAIHASEDGQMGHDHASAMEMKMRFDPLLQHQPPPPVSYTLRFRSGSASELTAESAAVLEQLFASLDQREAPEIRLIGHTDSVGSLLENDQLSKRRARTVAEILRRKGIAPEMIEVTGRGERDLAVATADGIDEPRNRRVEISIR